MEIGGWLKNDKKQLKPSRVDNSGVPGLYPAKAGTMRLDQWQGSWDAFFYFILACTCFWPQTDKVYLFLAVAPKNNLKLKKERKER